MTAHRPLENWLALGLVAATAMGCRAMGRGDQTTLSVFAASSLTEAFEALERDFETRQPGVDVALSFAGSQVLRLQIEQGARADVFASANPAHLEALANAALVGPAQPLARNGLVVIVPPDNPADIESFEDLPRGERIVIGTPGVPVGAYTRRMLDRAGAALGSDFADRVRGHVVSEEANVRLVRAKVELGEADAAIVYRTDAAASKRVRTVPIPPSVDVEAEYSIAPVRGSPHSESARRFIDYARSDEGRETLAAHGFSPEAS